MPTLHPGQPATDLDSKRVPSTLATRGREHTAQQPSRGRRTQCRREVLRRADGKIAASSGLICSGPAGNGGSKLVRLCLVRLVCQIVSLNNLYVCWILISST
ncbi:unnamed protein product [Urochloa humidicola]